MSDFIAKLQVRSRALKRMMMWHCLSGVLPLYLVTEFPKSGGTWFSQMLADVLGVPFYRNASQQRLCRSVMAGHRLYNPRFKNVTLVLRDGRDAIVSAYYHFLFKNDINWEFGVKKHRSYLQFKDYDDIRTNLPRFIEYVFNEYPKQGFHHFSWSQFIDSWWDKGAHVVRYEHLLTQPVPTLREAAQKLVKREFSDAEIEAIVQKYSFKNVAGRAAGSEDKSSFARKGIAGDWKNNFSSEACQVFNQFAGEHLIRVGYEADSSWVEQSCEQAV